MTPAEFKAFSAGLEASRKREAKAIMIERIRAEYPEIDNLDDAKFYLSRETAAACNTGSVIFLVNLYTGEVWADSDDLSFMLRACEKNPERYTIDRRADSVRIVRWGDTQDPVYSFAEVAISQYDANTGKRTAKPYFRGCFHDEDGDFYCMGRKCIYRES